MPTHESRVPSWGAVWLAATAAGRNPVDALVAAGLVDADAVAPDPPIATRPPPADPPAGYGLSRLMEPMAIPDDIRAGIEAKERERRAREGPPVVPIPAAPSRGRSTRPRRRRPRRLRIVG